MASYGLPQPNANVIYQGRANSGRALGQGITGALDNFLRMEESRRRKQEAAQLQKLRQEQILAAQDARTRAGSEAEANDRIVNWLLQKHRDLDLDPEMLTGVAPEDLATAIQTSDQIGARVDPKLTRRATEAQLRDTANQADRNTEAHDTQMDLMGARINALQGQVKEMEDAGYEPYYVTTGPESQPTLRYMTKEEVRGLTDGGTRVERASLAEDLEKMRRDMVARQEAAQKAHEAALAQITARGQVQSDLQEDSQSHEMAVLKERLGAELTKEQAKAYAQVAEGQGESWRKAFSAASSTDPNLMSDYLEAAGKIFGDEDPSKKDLQDFLRGKAAIRAAMSGGDGAAGRIDASAYVPRAGAGAATPRDYMMTR